MAKILFRHLEEVLTLQGAALKQGRRIKEADLGIQKKQAMLIEDGKIIWLGSDKKIPKNLSKSKIKEKPLKGVTVLPGFVECHTHAVFAGSRAAEFELRNNGISYQQIAAQGGGILSTVRATRAATSATLLASTQKRVDRFVRQGVTTVEIKSGYGLSLKDECKMLEVAKKVKGPNVVTTFLGAHAKSPEFNSYEEYLQKLTEDLQVIKKKKLSNRVDIFIEKGFFEKEPGKKYLKKAKDLGFEITIHADQLTLSGGSEAAIELSALSADHLICVGENEIQNLSRSEVTCVLLPAADLYMKCAYPPARKLIDAGARVALATDFNPGTSPTQDINLVGLLARLEMKMTLSEVISAYTIGAAWALGVQKDRGSLESGKSADFVCIEDSWSDLFYQAGRSSVTQVYRDGKIIANNMMR